MRDNQHMTRRQHWLADRARGRRPFGRGPSRTRTVLVVPELRKRRSERDPDELKRQQDRFAGILRRGR